MSERVDRDGFVLDVLAKAAEMQRGCRLERGKCGIVAWSA